jgi:hypothetical protein
VTFSEPVECGRLVASPPASTYYYYEEGVRSTAQLSGAAHFGRCDEQYTQSIVIVAASSAAEIVPYRDSLQLVANALDASGNGPPPADRARKAAIEVGGENRMDGIASPNPFVPGETLLHQSLPPATRTFYSSVIGNKTYGTLVAVSTVKPLKAGTDNSYGSAEVYDAVGNLVQDGLKVLRANSYRDYGVVWDGRNTNGRLVGGGGYLMVIQGVDIDGQTVGKRMMVGVKR